MYKCLAALLGDCRLDLTSHLLTTAANEVLQHATLAERRDYC